MKTNEQGSPCPMGTCGNGCLRCMRTVYNDCTVINNYSVSAEEMQRIVDAHQEQYVSSAPATKSKRGHSHTALETPVDKNIRKEIIQYVLPLRTYLAKEWRRRFEKDWNDILDMKVVSDSIYKVGKQQGTNFNRNLVANILYYMDGLGAFGKHYNATTMAMSLEGDKDSSVRAALRKLPAAAIVSRLDRHYADVIQFRNSADHIHEGA